MKKCSLLSLILSVCLCLSLMTFYSSASCGHVNLINEKDKVEYSVEGDGWHGILTYKEAFCTGCGEYITYDDYYDSEPHSLESDLISHHHISLPSTNPLDEHEYVFYISCFCGYSITETQVSACMKGGNNCYVPYSVIEE